MDAENIFQVFDWLWSSGQLSENDIVQLQKDGITTIINITTPDSPNWLKGEAELAANLHLNYFQIPVVWDLPEVAQFELWVGLINDLRQRGHKIWVHCTLNYRVSAFVYLYRKLILEESEEASVHPMQEIWKPIPLWREFMDEVIERYKLRSF